MDLETITLSKVRKRKTSYISYVMSTDMWNLKHDTNELIYEI